MQRSEIINELGKPKRIEMLKRLKKGIHCLRELTGNGVSSSTVSRILRWMCDNGIAYKQKEEYKLTGFGVAIEKLISAIRDISDYSEELITLPEFMDFLTPEIIAGIHNLKKCKVMHVEEALEIGLYHLANSKRYGLYIDKIIDYDVYKLMAKKNLEGVEERVISTWNTVFDRTSTFRRAISDLDLSERELDIIAEKVQIRIYDTPIQLGVIDGEIGILQLNDVIDRIYVSHDRDFIRWCEYLFWFIWQRSKPVDIKKIVEEVKAQKGFV